MSESSLSSRLPQPRLAAAPNWQCRQRHSRSLEWMARAPDILILAHRVEGGHLLQTEWVKSPAGLSLRSVLTRPALGGNGSSVGDISISSCNGSPKECQILWIGKCPFPSEELQLQEGEGIHTYPPSLLLSLPVHCFAPNATVRTT